jgi:hypothetical protein
MQRGTITILLILTVAVLAATASVFYHYANQRHAQDFWGSQTAKLIDKAPQVEVMRLGEADPSLAVTDTAPSDSGAEKASEDSTEPAAETPAIKALEFNQIPWIVLETRDAAPAKGISNLRRALVLDTTYNWSDVPPKSEPVWQYALGVTDGRDWASVLFDFDSRRVGLAGGRKVAMLHEEAAREFKQFFDEQFAAGTSPPAAESPATSEDPTAEPESDAVTEPAAKS